MKSKCCVFILQVTEPCMSAGLSGSDMEAFLNAYKDTIVRMDVFR